MAIPSPPLRPSVVSMPLPTARPDLPLTHAPIINSGTQFFAGFPISVNYILEHFTTGAYHPIMGKWMPMITSMLKPGGSGLPMWNIVANLSGAVSGIIEPLMQEFGGSLLIKSGFLNNIPSIANLNTSEINHLLGNSIDVMIDGATTNLYNHAKDIQKIAKRATSIDIIYGNTASIHINSDIRRALSTDLKVELPPIRSIDVVAGVVESGIQAFRGFL